MGEGLDEGLNLRPPEEGFELYRHKNVQSTRTRGWSGLYMGAEERGRLRDSVRRKGRRGTLDYGRHLPEGGLRGALREGEPSLVFKAAPARCVEENRPVTTQRGS